nr:hypothetical protein [Candidatus Sigynarchaeota archaeon]
MEREYLLDTTYIMPFFGIDVTIPDLKKDIARILPVHGKFIHITSCSLVEAKWKAIRNFNKTGRKEYLARANKALDSIGANKYIQVINAWFVKDASHRADALLFSGHQDYMDCWIAGAAVALNMTLVSEDEVLVQSIKKQDGVQWRAFRCIQWGDFLNELDGNRSDQEES